MNAKYNQGGHRFEVLSRLQNAELRDELQEVMDRLSLRIPQPVAMRVMSNLSPAMIRHRTHVEEF